MDKTLEVIAQMMLLEGLKHSKVTIDTIDIEKMPENVQKHTLFEDVTYYSADINVHGIQFELTSELFKTKNKEE